MDSVISSYTGLYSSSMGFEFALLGKGYVNIPHRFQEWVTKAVYMLQNYLWCLFPSNLLDHRAARGSQRQNSACSENNSFDTLASFICIWFIHKFFLFIHLFIEQIEQLLCGWLQTGDGNVVMNPTALVPAFLEFSLLEKDIKEINTQRNAWLQTVVGTMLEKNGRERERTVRVRCLVRKTVCRPIFTVCDLLFIGGISPSNELVPDPWIGLRGNSGRLHKGRGI